MSIAIALNTENTETTDEEQAALPMLRNEPEIKYAFSHVSRETGEISTENLPDYYRVVGIEDGSIPLARDLARAHCMRHCFNEESIIDLLEARGEEFRIAKVQILSEDHLATAKQPEHCGFYVMVPKV